MQLKNNPFEKNDSSTISSCISSIDIYDATTTNLNSNSPSALNT